MGWGCVFAGWGHKCCLYPWGPGAWLPGGAAGVRSGRAGLRAGVACAGFVSSFSCGPLGPGATCPPGRAGLRSLGCVFAGRGHKRCLCPWGPGACSPGGTDSPGSAPEVRAGLARGGAAVVGSPVRHQAVGRVSAAGVRGRVPARGGAITVVYTHALVSTSMAARRGGRCPLGPGGVRGVAGLCGGVASFLRSVRRAGVRWCGLGCLGSCGRVGPGLGRVWVGRSTGFGLVWVGVSGRLVRRRCRSGRCAGGTRGRDRTPRWWSPPPEGSMSGP